MSGLHLASAASTATQVKHARDHGDVETADRILTGMISRLLLAPADTVIPDAVLAEPGSTGDRRYDVLLAVAVAFALDRRGAQVPAWAEQVPALDRQWLWDGDVDASTEFRGFIRDRTPPMFLAKNILLRERDLGYDAKGGPFYDAAGLATLRGVTRQAIHAQMKKRHILGVKTGDGDTLFPAFQFGPRGEPLPQLREVLSALVPGDVDGWGSALWLNTPVTRFSGRTAVELLRAGDVSPVLAAAAHDAGPWAG